MATRRNKYGVRDKDGLALLFDLQEDPFELVNLAGDAAIEAELQDRLYEDQVRYDYPVR